MKRIFAYAFFPIALWGGCVIDSLDKAKKMALLFEKPIICFFDEGLEDEARAQLAKEYFNQKDFYDAYSATHLFSHTKKGDKGVSGFMIISSKGEVLKTITTYDDRRSFSEDICGLFR